jgi:GTP diphosphokinase / guanosine-3',5'-bis(diphosphate) 3'-diphosphatase
VEVLTSANAHPSKDWLTFVKTSRAQARIRGYIKAQQREKSLELGRELAERELKRFDLNLNRLLKGGEIKKAAEALGYRLEDDLLAAIGYGKVAPSQVAAKLLPADKLAEKKAENGEAHQRAAPIARFTDLLKKVTGHSRTGVQINGIDDVLVRFGRCCNPVPGDKIVGFITRGRGVTVHTLSCEKALASDPERRVDVSWDVKADFKRPVTIRVLTADRPGLLADISQTFSKKGVNISQANCRATGDDRAVNTFEVTISDLKQLNEVIQSLERIQGVFTVERV